MIRPVLVVAVLVGALVAGAPSVATHPASAHAPAVPTVAPGGRACRVTSIRKSPTTFENAAISPASHAIAVTQLDAHGVYQVYVAKSGSHAFRCISCARRAGGPRLDRNKPMISWHPSGRWLVVGIEEDRHDLAWVPAAWQRGLLQSGIWLNMWITTPTGDRWYQITDFRKSAGAPSDGFVGTQFTPDGRHAVWAEIVDGNIFANHFGRWRLYMADFLVRADGTPTLANKRDITPAGARWVEPGNVSPDGRQLLLSSDVGIGDAQGQDQFALDLATGRLRNLTQSPTVWDEHGLYAPNGRKIVFMSSYPYRHEPGSYNATSLRTEFMLMDADGGHLQQLTHFNVPGYPEYSGHTIAAVAEFTGDGSELFGMVMGPNFTKTNWTITFAGRCGGR